MVDVKFFSLPASYHVVSLDKNVTASVSVCVCVFGQDTGEVSKC